MIHYSFPPIWLKKVISQRKDAMKKTCKELGMTVGRSSYSRSSDRQWNRTDAAIPERRHSPANSQIWPGYQYIWFKNCPMYDVIIDEAFKLKFMVAEQCCPTPLQAYPTVLGLQISEKDAWNFTKVNGMISKKAAAAGMTGRLGGWPMPATVFMPQYAVELAKKMIEDPSFDYKGVNNLNKFAKEVTGCEVSFSKFKAKADGPEFDNYYVMIMDSILY